jgi:hypothetical protein
MDVELERLKIEEAVLIVHSIFCNKSAAKKISIKTEKNQLIKPGGLWPGRE